MSYKFKGTKGKWYLQKYTDAYTNIIRAKTEKHESIFLFSTPQYPSSETRCNAKLASKYLDLSPEVTEIIVPIMAKAERVLMDAIEESSKEEAK